MGASIYVIPHAKRHRVSVAAPSSLIKALGIPVDLDEDDLPFLYGVVAGGNQDAKEIIKAIERHGRIRVVAEW